MADVSEVLLKSADPALQHITISLRINVVDHESYEARVHRIVDGDTLQVRFSALGLVDSVRLLGIDAPETGSDDHAKQQCQYLGVEISTLHTLVLIASFHLQWLLPKGSKITLETTESARDKGKRILAGIFTGDTCVNRLMVEHGYAIAFQGYSDWEDYSELENQARKAKRGIWGACDEPFYPASSKLYHRPGCNSARRATTRFETLTQAKASGLGPCSNCLPDFSRLT
jgi:endonuclease YncB( thermonuclease family)